MTIEKLTDLAERCLSIIEGMNDDVIDDAREMIFVGEPDLAIADVLDFASDHPELYAEFPDEVYELAKDPQWRAIHVFLTQLEASRK